MKPWEKMTEEVYDSRLKHLKDCQMEEDQALWYWIMGLSHKKGWFQLNVKNKLPLRIKPFC